LYNIKESIIFKEKPIILNFVFDALESILMSQDYIPTVRIV